MELRPRLGELRAIDNGGIDMTSTFKRLGAASLVVIWLVAMVPATALALVNWSVGCSGTANSNYVCNYSDRNFSGVWGHWAGSDSSYVNQNYNSGTSTTVNDTTSSVKNLYGSKDVTWHNEPNQAGAGFCVNPNTIVSWVGLFSNDAFSSHQVATDNNAC